MRVVELQLPDASELVIGISEDGANTGCEANEFDILLSLSPDCPRPWVWIRQEALATVLANLEHCAIRQGSAIALLKQLLSLSEDLTFDEAVVAESLAYSNLLGREEFASWRRAKPPRQRPDDGQRIGIRFDGDLLWIRLERIASRNAFDAAMRDEFAAALDFAASHPDEPSILVSGEGPDFSAGGDLDEFGTAEDLDAAHLIRVRQSIARRTHALRHRISFDLHGACIGAGIEIPAAASRVSARPDTFFRLPEIGMGLIPGAGGTVSIPRRIGRHRTAYMALTGTDIDVTTALSWGLVDEIRL